MGKRDILKKAALTVFSLLLFSCSDNLLKTPKGDGTDDSSNTASVISAPADLTATNGGYRSVELSWKSVNGAYRYLIYSSSSPFDQFEQIWETNDTDYKVTVPAGKTRYYKIQAINYSGTKSPFSNVAVGSSLASPVITSIVLGSEGTNATVNWWMENCSSSTYGNYVRYTITVYSENKANIVKEMTVTGDVSSAVLNGLTPKTKYYFNVEAYLESAQTDVESSGMIDAETARKLIPGAPENVEIDQGISVDSIKLTWNCPDYVDVSAGNGTYEQKPVYFKIFRKKADSAENYVELVSYIGSVLAGDSSKGQYNFDCVAGSASDSRLSVVQATGEGAVTDGNYKYTSHSTLTFTDSTELERNVRYSYKIQSYVDDVKKTVSADSCAAEEEGWLVSIPVLEVTGDYVVEEETPVAEGLSPEKKYTKITFRFSGDFENFGKTYSFILKEKKTDIDGNNPVYKESVFTSFGLLKNHVIEFTDPASSEGYYEYEVYVCPEGSENSSSAYASAAAPGKLIVTDDATLVPEITNFTVTDGYSDKFIISFDYVEKYQYTLMWMPVVNGQNGEQESELLTAEKLTISVSGSGKKAEYVHSAVSGDRRIYILEANNEGIKSDKTTGDVSETLGPAKIYACEKKYDRIQVRWEKVQKADDYSVEAYYSETPSQKFVIADDAVETEDGENYTCTIVNPQGWNDASVSGKPVTVKITSKNTLTGSTSAGAVETSTLGPACVEQKATVHDRESLTVTWKKIEGAAGYIVGRGKCSDGFSGKVLSADSYFVSADGSTVKIEGDAVGEERVELNLYNGIYTLRDKCAPTSDSETSQISYKTNQSQIAWGLEYKYTVIPVLTEKDFEFEVKSDKAVLTSKAAVAYGNLGFVSNGANGYGLELKAEKACDDKKIKISWKQPFGCDSSTKTPSVYIRESDSTKNVWKYGEALVSSGDATRTAEFVPSDPTQAYDFLVVYDNGNTTITITDSYENELKKIKAADSPTEQQNKGYLLSLKGIYADYVQNFTEQVSWNPYDFDKRALGPDRYEIQVNNMNSSKGWVTIADIGVDVASGDYGNTADISKYKNSAKISEVNKGTASLQIEPVFDLKNGEAVADGQTGTNTSGVLKVLRDPKHYYRLVAYRKIDDENTAEASVGSDFTAFAYRNVTDEEIVKSAMLTLAYSFYLHDGGKEDLSNVTTQFKYASEGTLKSWDGNGSVYFTSAKAMNTQGKMYYTLKEYAPSMLTPGGKKASFLRLTAPEYSCALNTSSIADRYIYCFRNSSTGNQIFTVSSGVDFESRVDYSAEIVLLNEYGKGSSNTKMKLSIKHGETETVLCDTTGATDQNMTEYNKIRKCWFPMQIWSDSQYEIKSSAYGWWED